jgi:hypothetical protein
MKSNFFCGVSSRPLMSGLIQSVQISDSVLFQTLIKVSLYVTNIFMVSL